MRPFTDKEFGVMVEELTVKDPPGFGTLLNIVEKTLRKPVESWCASDKRLSGRRLEDDIMQETMIRVVKTCVTHFLYRGGTLNNDPDGFRNWLYEVAINIKRDIADSQFRHESRERGFEADEENSIEDPAGGEREAAEAVNERLAEAFDTVLGSGVKVYKILTWLSQCVFMIEYGMEKRCTNDELVKEFAEKTLYDMRDSIYAFAEGVPWMDFTFERRQTIDAALAEQYGEKTYGETKYKEFFMKKDGKASISDWVNRMNGLIKRRTEGGI